MPARADTRRCPAGSRLAGDGTIAGARRVRGPGRRSAFRLRERTCMSRARVSGTHVAARRQSLDATVSLVVICEHRTWSVRWAPRRPGTPPPVRLTVAVRPASADCAPRGACGVAGRRAAVPVGRATWRAWRRRAGEGIAASVRGLAAPVFFSTVVICVVVYG